MKFLKRIGIIDIGSNSIRLVVFDGPKRSPLYLYNEKVFYRLGQKSGGGQDFTDKVLVEVTSIIDRFATVSRSMKVLKIIAFGTSALREANNSNDLIKMIFAKTGINVEIISGETEASYAGKGILLGFPNSYGVICDLGGNSVEFGTIIEGKIKNCKTALLGPLAVNKLIGNGIDIRAHIKTVLSKMNVIEHNELRKKLFLIGGSWRAIAKFHMELTEYPIKIIQGYKIKAKALKRTLSFINSEKGKKRLLMTNIPNERLELLPHSVTLLEMIFETYKFDSVVFSSFGVREGIIYDRLSEKEKNRDPLLEAAKYFERKESRFPKLSRSVFSWISPLLKGLNKKTKRLILAACRLHDITWIAHPDYKMEMCLELITRSNITGVSHKDRIFLAMILLFRHKIKIEVLEKLDLFDLVSKRKKSVAMVVGKSLRLASTFFGEKNLFQEIKLLIKNDEVVLEIPEYLKSLEGEIVERRKHELNKALKIFISNKARKTKLLVES